MLPSSTQTDSAPHIVTFDNSYARLPDAFFARLAPEGAPSPALLRFNSALAEDLGIDVSALDEREIAAVFAGNRLPEGADPLAMAYAGHQFGGFVPQLGDGRAHLLGEVVDKQGTRRDIQLKGSGQTPFSRRGDGRAAVGPVLREYIVSEAMHALGIPTTRSLAAVSTGDWVYREERLPGAILTRVANSHIRVGTFQYFAGRQNVEALKTLVAHVVARSVPDAVDADSPALVLLQTVTDRQAALVAKWMQVGFIHGVMNTDNMAISGETIDYGPCAFMDTYAAGTVFSSIDHMGRYAFANQPPIAQWNLARFAETLLPLLHETEATAIEIATAEINRFPAAYSAAWTAGMRAKLGLANAEEEDGSLAEDLLEAMETGKADFTQTFRALSTVAESEDDSQFRSLFTDTSGIHPWLEKWRARSDRAGASAAERAALMKSVNPIYIPRNHLVEEALTAAVSENDLGPFEILMQVLANPFAEQAAREEFATGPEDKSRPYRTFCGT